jgi:predicted nucleic acid-binding protein
LAIRVNYLDASAIVKLVVRENRSRELQDYFSYLGDSYLTTSLCFSETLGALSQKYKKGEIGYQEYLQACEELLCMERDCSIEIYDVGISDRHAFDQAERMILAYENSRKRRLDLSDAFQLVTLKMAFPTLENSSKLLITADCYLARVAEAEGLAVWNVMTDDPPAR